MTFYEMLKENGINKTQITRARVCEYDVLYLSILNKMLEEGIKTYRNVKERHQKEEES